MKPIALRIKTINVYSIQQHFLKYSLCDTIGTMTKTLKHTYM